MHRHANAVWKGTLTEGTGTLDTQSGALANVPYSFKGRFQDESGKSGTNPEELIAAAHAGCFSMALALGLGQAGFTPRRIRTKAAAHIERVGDGFRITRIELDTEADVPDIDPAQFREQAETARRDCPVSRALAGTEITLQARLAAA